MKKPNFSKLSDEILRSYITDIQNELASREQISAKREKVLEQVRSLAEAEGLSVNDLLPGGGARTATTKRRSTGSVAPKYENPSNTAEKWTGRGRQPKWVQAFLAQPGNTLDQLLIK